MGKLVKYLLPVLLVCLSVFIVAGYLIKTPEKTDSTTDESLEAASYYIDPRTPPKLQTFLRELLESESMISTETPDDADVKVMYQPEKVGEDDITFHQIWVIARKYSSYLNEELKGNVSVSETIDTNDYSELVGEYLSTPVSPETFPVLYLLNIDELSPEYKRIQIDGSDPLSSKTWENASYPLISTTSVSGNHNKIMTKLSKSSMNAFLLENHYFTKLPSESDILTIMKTGTSVTGGPGWELCERKKSLDYPILEVKSLTNAADLTIISNETSFVDGCSQKAGTTAFCGKPSYLQNIKDLGVDIVSLTGNHMCDYGKAPFEDMLATYDNNDIDYFAGGADTQEAWTPLMKETSAGTIAFIGYNYMGPSGVLAGETSAGTAYYEHKALQDAIDVAKKSADIIWVDTHLWPEYGTVPDQDQITLSREAIDFGADIVTGVSSHEIQGMSFYKGKPIFYGLGNFLFDQMWSTETRQGLVLKVTLYDGSISAIDLLPTMMYDYCQPRFTEAAEKEALIEYFLSISNL